ncbi:ATP-binding cassette domain-containing protein [Desulfocurvus sp. DL9XJH121]
MREFFRRLSSRPWVTAQMLGATFFVNLLGFASPLFVMLILGQYVNSGFDGTLVTLSTGMLIALLMQVGFRQARLLMARLVSEAPDREMAEAVYRVVTRARTMALLRVPDGVLQEMDGHVQSVRGAYAPQNICVLLDAPFALLFVAATFWFSSSLAWIGLAGMGLTVAAGAASLAANRKAGLELQRASITAQGAVAMALDGADTVRAFGAAGFLRDSWGERLLAVLTPRRTLAALRGRQGVSVSILAVLVRVLIYAWGAKECVLGALTFVDLIVANILVGRGLRQAAMLVGAMDQVSRATQARGILKDFFRLPLEPASGSALRGYDGRLEFRDVSFGFPGGTGPLFESFDLSVPAGRLVLVHGGNGAGKTTLARLVAGLLEPTRGEILAGGVTLRQLAPPWWRSQLAYVPQEPEFLPGTLRENILLANPDVGEEALDRAVRQAGLAPWAASSPQGLDTPVRGLGRNLPLGVRRRAALARALLTEVRLAVLDEPFEGLDEEGAEAVRTLIRGLGDQGRTVIVLSHDPGIIENPHIVVDLDVKPVPAVATAASPEGAAHAEHRHA